MSESMTNFKYFLVLITDLLQVLVFMNNNWDDKIYRGFHFLLQPRKGKFNLVMFFLFFSDRFLTFFDIGF